MKNFVITTEYSNWECSGECVYCIQYESLEKLEMDLELFFEKCKEEKKWLAKFHHIGFDIGIELSYNRKYVKPTIQELDEWFLSKLEE